MLRVELNFLNIKKDVQVTSMFLKKQEKPETRIINLIKFNKFG